MKYRLVLVIGAALALSLPAGFAAAQAVQGSASGPGAAAETDPNPATNPLAEHQAAEEAYAAGNEVALEKASAEIREEQLSRVQPEEREAEESAPPQVQVPKGTLAYLPPSMPSSIIANCEKTLKERGSEPLCTMILLHSEGKLRAGAFSPQQVNEAMALAAEAASTGGK
ncbi:MAG TPA: hypothetical protein VF731_02395 [Solirubrobacterales bacterium]